MGNEDGGGDDYAGIEAGDEVRAVGMGMRDHSGGEAGGAR